MFVHANQLCFRNRLRRRLASVFVVTNAKYLPEYQCTILPPYRTNELWLDSLCVGVLYDDGTSDALQLSFFNRHIDEKKESQHVYSVHCTQCTLDGILYSFIPYSVCLMRFTVSLYSYINACMYCVLRKLFFFISFFFSRFLSPWLFLPFYCSAFRCFWWFCLKKFCSFWIIPHQLFTWVASSYILSGWISNVNRCTETCLNKLFD